MQEYQVKKEHHASGVVRLSTGSSIRGRFYLSGVTTEHSGPERVGDLLNREDRFFPFEVEPQAGGSTHTSLLARHYVLYVKLDGHSSRGEGEAGLAMASTKFVSLLLSNGERLRGEIYYAMPAGKERLSDIASAPERFRYFGSKDALSLVNFEHVVEILPITE